MGQCRIVATHGLLLLVGPADVFAKERENLEPRLVAPLPPQPQPDEVAIHVAQYCVIQCASQHTGLRGPAPLGKRGPDALCQRGCALGSEPCLRRERLRCGKMSQFDFTHCKYLLRLARLLQQIFSELIVLGAQRELDGSGIHRLFVGDLLTQSLLLPTGYLGPAVEDARELLQVLLVERQLFGEAPTQCVLERRRVEGRTIALPTINPKVVAVALQPGTFTRLADGKRGLMDGATHPTMSKETHVTWWIGPRAARTGHQMYLRRTGRRPRGALGDDLVETPPEQIRFHQRRMAHPRGVRARIPGDLARPHPPAEIGHIGEDVLRLLPAQAIATQYIIPLTPRFTRPYDAGIHLRPITRPEESFAFPVPRNFHTGGPR